MEDEYTEESTSFEKAIPKKVNPEQIIRNILG